MRAVVIQRQIKKNRFSGNKSLQFGKLFLKQHLKVPSRSRFCDKIGKFKIGVILVKDRMEIMEIRAFSKRWYEKTRACLYFIFSRFQAIFYLDLRFTSFLFLPPEQRKQCNVSCFLCYVTAFRRRENV